MFLTEEKVLKKIAQDRARNDLKRACERALDAVERWPANFDLAMEAVQLCIDLGDNHKAVALLKKAIVRHAKKRSQIEEYALDMFRGSLNPFLGSFLVELRLKRRDIEGIRLILKQAPESFIDDLIKRSETRRQSETAGPGSIENDILLGLLYIESKQGEKAAGPFGRVIVADPDSSQTFGGILVELEREMPHNAELKFHLARTSILLSHPDKAESRLFQCLELKDPPLPGIIETLDEAPETSENHLLLKGEALIRVGRCADGIDCVKAFLAERGDRQAGAGTMSHLFSAGEDRQVLVESRLRLLPDESFSDPDLTFLYCNVASARGKSKDTAERLEHLYRSGGEHAARIIDWCERAGDQALAGETERLLAEIFIETSEYKKAAEAARRAVERDRTLLSSILDLVRNAVESATETHPPLNKILAELYARAGNSESASEVLASLTNMEKIDNDDILNLSGEIMKHAGVSLDGVLRNIEAAIRKGSVTDSAPYVRSLCIERPDNVRDLALTLQRKAEGTDSYWQPLADLLDYLAKDEKPPKPLAFLKALSHLESGSIEKAIFEFDQLLMLDGDLRHELIPAYERAAERHDRNATLHLALYQLHLEDGQLPLAAHYLCRTIEIDPEQVRDVLERFDKLVEMEPGNISIWEEMLKSALASNRVSLARDVLRRAIETLPEKQSASLHVYGTKISISDGNFEDALKCIALALTGEGADLRTIEDQLEHILMASPGNQEARFLLANAYLRLGREESAVAAFRDSLSISPAYSEKIQKQIEKALPASIKPWLLSSLLAEIAWSEERFEDAYRLFATAQQGSGESLAELGRTLERLYETSPGNTKLALVYARNLHLTEKYDDCVALLDDISSVDKASAKRAFEILFEMLDKSPDHFGGNKLLARLATEAGNADQSLEPVVRMLAHDEIDPDELDEIVSSYRPLYENRGKFLIPYAGLKARKKESGEALASYRKALEIESGSWERVLEGVQRHEWPEEARLKSELLEIDCMIAGNRLDGACEGLRAQRADGPDQANELIRRLETLIEREPKRDHFVLGASWLAKIDDIDGAERLLVRGCELLGDEESTGLRIELVDILHNAGMLDRAAPILNELISSSDDKTSILKSMERSYIQRTEQEIENLSNRPGNCAAEETERYIQICIERGRTDEARSALSDSDLPREKQICLLSETYLAEDRPASVLALFGSCRESIDPETDEGVRTLYAAGLAGELLGDYGGAHAAFSRILASGRPYRDSDERAKSNHTRFIETSLGEKAMVLEAVGSLDGLPGGEDTK